jgi:chaperonin GroES
MANKKILQNITPLQDCVAVIKDVEDDIVKTASGIFVSQKETKQSSLKATVIAVGPGKLLDNGSFVESALTEGDRVVYGGYAGTEVEHQGIKFSIMHEADILAIIGD